MYQFKNQGAYKDLSPNDLIRELHAIHAHTATLPAALDQYKITDPGQRAGFFASHINLAAMAEGHIMAQLGMVPKPEYAWALQNRSNAFAEASRAAAYYGDRVFLSNRYALLQAPHIGRVPSTVR